MSNVGLARKREFIIVSNRLPVSVTKKDGTLIFSASSGGLATAMASIGHYKLWLGWPGIASDDLTPSDKRTITRRLREYGCAPVFLTKKQIEEYYDGYANRTIWPLFHYFQNEATYDLSFWEQYKKVNDVFQRAVTRYATPDATIWVHDYHLMLLPRLIRQKIPDASIGFFIHIPFPSYEIFRVLPNRVEILRGLLGADLIGFHTYDYTQHFIRSVGNILGFDTRQGVITLNNRKITTDAFPIGIDYQKWKEAALNSPAVKTEAQVLLNRHRGQRIIISVDRLDYTKGIVNRLEAFDSFLKKNTKYHGRVTLIVLAVPSRTDVHAYQQLRDAVEMTVSRINGTYATTDWSPITYQYQNLPFEKIAALYSVADVAFVTPLRDGMNLVSKEYIATKQKKPGVLILSEMAGASHELAEAIRINPYDTANIVTAIEQALKTPRTEQRRSIQAMQARLSHYSVIRWAYDFTEQLVKAKNTSRSTHQTQIDAYVRKKLQDEYRTAKKRLFLLDYDGTLKDFVPPSQANQARPSQHVLKILTDLAADKRNVVCIVSGRPRSIMQAWFPDERLFLAAEHGAAKRINGTWTQIATDFHDYKPMLIPILKSHAERTAGAIVEEKEQALVWHYRGVVPELASLRKASLKHDISDILRDSDIDLFEGNKILEIKPRAIHKGAVVLELFRQSNADFVLSIGDDYTDEDMFAVLPKTAWTIKVRLGDTKARYLINSVSDVVELLSTLNSRH